MREKLNMIGLVIVFFLPILLLLSFFELKRSLILKSQLLREEQRLSEIKIMEGKLKDLDLEQKRLDQYLSQISEVIPENEGRPLGLVEKISALAGKLGLGDLEFNFQRSEGDTSGIDWEAETVFQLSSDNQEEREGFPGPTFKVKPLFVEISFESNFRQLVKFLSEIFQLKRIITLQRIEINRSDKVFPRQEIKLQLITYTFVTH